MTYSDEFFKGLNKWKEISGQSQQDSYVVYAGKEKWTKSQGEVFPWQNLNELFLQVYS